MSSDQMHKNSVIKESLLVDLILFGSLVVIVFGGSFSLEYAREQKEVNGFTANFTDISTETASDQLAQGFQSIYADFMFELGWVESESRLIGGLFDFVINPATEVIEEKNPSMMAQLVESEIEGAVLGMTDSDQFSTSNLQKNPVDTIKKSNGLVLKPDYSSNKRVFLEYYPGDSKVKSVDFYINDALVTRDKTYPYFLGGDSNGEANGYSLNETVTVKAVVTLDNPPMYSVKTDRMTINL